MIEHAIGKEIEIINRGDMLLNGLPNEDDQGPLELVFSDGGVLLMELEQDGEAVKHQWFSEQPEVLFAETCDWNRIDLTKSEPYSRIVGSTVVSLGKLLFGDKEKQDVVAGYGVKFSTGDFIVYYNMGDFAKIYWNGYPPVLPEPFVLQWAEGAV